MHMTKLNIETDIFTDRRILRSQKNPKTKKSKPKPNRAVKILMLYQCPKVCSFSPWYWYITFDKVSSPLIMTKLKNLRDVLTEALWSSEKRSKILRMRCNIPMQAGHQMDGRQLDSAGQIVLVHRKLNLNKGCTLAAMETDCMLWLRKISRLSKIIIPIFATFVKSNEIVL